MIKFKGKKIRLTSLILAFCFLFSSIAYADGDVNIGNGGGDGDYDSSTGSGTTILGNEQDEGVRVTLVDSKTGVQVTTPIDFANNPRQPIKRHFGKVTKLSYKNGTDLKLVIANESLPYDVKKTDVPLPKVINGDLGEIKAYFGDKSFITNFSKVTGFNYDEMISGKYKLLIEPVAYPKIKGVVWAMTSTELAMYDEKLGNYIRRHLLDFSHRDLPLSMFLEKAELGIPRWSGTTNNHVRDNSVIKKALGVGIISFKEEETEKPPVIDKMDYTYRTNTEVITSINVSGGESNPDQPVRVEFDILDKTYNVGSIYYPSGESQLAWVKWKTPSKPQDIQIPVRIIKEQLDPPPSVCNPSDDPPRPAPIITETTINVQIKEIIENTPPEPDADDLWNNGRTKFNHWEANNYEEKYKNDNGNFAYFPQKTSAKWHIWKAKWIPNLVEVPCLKQCNDGYVEEVRDPCEHDYVGSHSYNNNGITEYCSGGSYDYVHHYCRHGQSSSHSYTVYYTVDRGHWEYEKDEKYASLKPEMGIYPDKYCPTSIKRFDEYEMKSGYGLDQNLDARFYTNDLNNVTNPQNAISTFIDFWYLKKGGYFRLLEMTDYDNNSSMFKFFKNHYAIEGTRTHFTPIWFPDRMDYVVNSYVFDIWTPVGMLSKSLKDEIHIDGNMWQDWTVRPLPVD